MGSAFYVSLNKDVPGVDPACDIDGKLLSKAQEKLDKTAANLNVKPLMSYFSVGAEARQFLQDEGFADSGDIPPETWFDTVDGLVTVRALIDFITSNPSTIKNSDGVLVDLKALEQILSAASDAGAKFHLSIDI
jgi:hypothetical protein